jgi:hypothetical protein
MIYMRNQQSGNLRRAAEALAVWEDRKRMILELYVNGDMSQLELAMMLGVCQQGVSKGLKLLGIASKSRGRAGALNGRYVDGAQSTLYRQMIEKSSCETCGATAMLVIHHRDHNHTNNTPDNLAVLCSPCHSSYHKTDYWRRRKTGQ